MCSSRRQTNRAPRRRRHRQRRELGRLISLAAPERLHALITSATTCLMGASISQMAMPAFVGSFISLRHLELPHHDDGFKDLAHVTMELIVIFIIGAFFSFWRGYLFTLAGERVVARLRKALFSHILSLEISFFDESKTRRAAQSPRVRHGRCSRTR